MRQAKRLTLIMLLVLIGVVANGCILLSPDRLRDFKGPSWDVPLRVPLLTLTELRLSEVLDLEAGNDGTLEFRLDLPAAEPFYVFHEAAEDLVIPVPVQPVREVTVDLADLNDFPEIDFNDAFLIFLAQNDPDIEGTLEIEALLDGVPTFLGTVDLQEAAPQEVSIQEILNQRPDELVVRLTSSIPAQPVSVEAGDRVGFSLQLKVPFHLRIPADGVDLTDGSATVVSIEQSVREEIRNAPLTAIELFVHVVNRTPIGLDARFDFANTADPAGDPTAVAVDLSIPSAGLDQGKAVAPTERVVRIEVDETLREKLASQPLFVVPSIEIPGGGEDRTIVLQADDYIAYKAHVVVTVAVNK